MSSASRNGHLDVVKWLHENRTEGCTTYAMDWASRNGHLNVVKWLHENRTEGFFARGDIKWLIMCHHLDVLKWLHKNGYYPEFVEETYNKPWDWSKLSRNTRITDL
jgi:hypothetical protein